MIRAAAISELYCTTLCDCIAWSAIGSVYVCGSFSEIRVSWYSFQVGMAVSSAMVMTAGRASGR